MTVHAGREFIALTPPERLHKFVERRHQITTHIKCIAHLEQEGYWREQFDRLWDEVESCKTLFAHYFISAKDDPQVNEQKMVYNKLIKTLGRDRQRIAIVDTIGEAVVEHLLGLGRQDV